MMGALHDSCKAKLDSCNQGRYKVVAGPRHSRIHRSNCVVWVMLPELFMHIITKSERQPL